MGFKRNNGLTFINESKSKTKRFATFSISFLCFSLVLGSVSFLILFKSANYDFKNLVDRKETTDTTIAESTTAINSEKYAGKANILAICCDTSGKLIFSSVLNVDFDNKIISVCTLANDVSCISNNITASFASHYVAGGSKGLKMAVEAYSGITVDRYFKVTETNFKKIISSLGDVTLIIPSKISYMGDDYALNVEAGEQSMTGETLLSYLKYSSSNQRSEIIADVFDYYMNSKKVTATESTFETVINYLETDISIVDFTNYNKAINMFIADTSRQKSVATSNLSTFIGE